MHAGGKQEKRLCRCMSYRVHYVCVLEALEDVVPVSGRRTKIREPARPHVNCGQSLKPTRDAEPRDQDVLVAETNKCILKKNLQGAKNGGITLRSKLMQG
jgi:rRNA maturation protein Nop10